MLRWLAVLSAALNLAALAPLRAQCPDGSPPPCRGTAMTPRAADPPIDDRRWIVLPFTNVTRAQDVSWLSDASVDLLSLDLSRWSDVRVVDANRVADLMRAVPEAERTRIGLANALAVAKRAGAARLVLGQFLREAGRTAITARVFDVRSGERVRVAEDTAATIDLVSAAYSRLAPKVLSLTPPPGTTLTGLGTSSTQAVRAYTLGMQTWGRGRTDSAAFFFLQAIEVDSLFALAHYRLGQVIGSTTLGSRYPGGASRAAATAARLASTLPERERLVIGAGRTACERGTRLLALDSADADGWMLMATCYNSERGGVIVGADGSLRRDASPEAARKAYERALSLGPKGGAVRSLQLLTNGKNARACPAIKPACTPSEQYRAAVVFDGDTLSMVFEPWRPFDPPARRKEYEAPRRAKIVALADFWRRYTAMHPEDLLGHATLGLTYAQLRQPDSARAALTHASELAALVGDRNREVFNAWRNMVELQSGHPERAAALVDSIIKSTGFLAVGETEAIALGRFGRVPAGKDTAARARLRLLSPVTAGIVPQDFDHNLRAFVAADTVEGAAIEKAFTALAFHALRRRPASDTSEFSLYRYQAFLTLGDTARARAALDAFDAWGRQKADDYFDGYEMFAAESRLELGDTTTAWTRIAPFADRFAGYDLNFGDPPLLNAFVTQGGPTTIMITGRAWLLYADLAMATGHRAEARRGYRMVVGMWENGDAPVQPLVARAKQALAKLD